MAMFDTEIRTRQGTCPEHGRVQAVKEVPAIKFPFLITAPARGLAALRPYRCPACGAKAS
jgi:hypothetical protein